MDTGTRIKIFRKRVGLSQEALAKLTGYTDRSSIARVEKGEIDISESKIKLFAAALGVSVTDILGLTEPMEIAEKTYTFGILGDIAAGYDLFTNEEYTNGSVEIPASWLRGRPQSDYFVLRVSGDSMYPTYQDGDLVLILRQSTMNHSGQIGAVIFDDDKPTIKRIEYVYGEDWMRLVPINPSFPPMMVTDERLEHCHVLGVVKKLVRDVIQ